MSKGKRIAVILPTYNEKDSIADVIRRFESLGVVDGILVVNRNAAVGMSENVAKTGAREVLETRQGYGAASRRGLSEIDADLICFCEPDGTFNPEDLSNCCRSPSNASLWWVPGHHRIASGRARTRGSVSSGETGLSRN